MNVVGGGLLGMERFCTYFVCGFIAYFVLLYVDTWCVAAELQRRFPALWAAAGQPQNWLNTNVSRGESHFFTFLDEKRYLETADPALIRHCQRLRVCWYACFLMFIVVLLGGMAFAVHKIGGA